MSWQATNWATAQRVGSPMGKIILLMIANRADEDGRCFPSQQRLANDCECSVRVVRKWLSAFEQRGLLRRCERRRDNGRKTSDEIYLAIDGLFAVQAGEPANIAGCSSEARDAASDLPPHEQQPAPGSGKTSAARGADFTGTRCRLTSNRTYQDSVGSVRATLDEFDRVFWEAYPHKVGKGQARSAWQAARRKADLATIMDGLQRYCRSKPERIAWCNPSTWLNGERWLDQPVCESRSRTPEPRAVHGRGPQAKSVGERICDLIDQQVGGGLFPDLNKGPIIDG